MNKSILAAAIAAGLMVPGLAAADVKIYGVIQAETGNIDVDTQGAGGDTDTTLTGAGKNGAIFGGGPNQLGFKGTEKLGNGLTAYFNLNSQFSTFDGSATFIGRDSYVGIKGDGWHAQFGTMNSLYKTASHKWDPFVATGLANRGLGGVSNLHNNYIDNVGEVGFKSGAWSGGIQMKWEDSTADANTDGTNDNAIDAGSWNGRVVYKDGPWTAIFNYMDLDYGSGGGDSDAWKAGAKYAANGWSVSAVYEDLEASTAAGGGTRPNGGSNFFVNYSGSTAVGAAEDYDSLSINATYKLSDATTLAGTYANADLERGTGGIDTDIDKWAVGVIHGLSKRTSVYGGYTAVDYDESAGGLDQDVDIWALGLRHKF